MGYLKKILYIFSEEGIFNLITRAFRYFIYVVKRFSGSNNDDEKWESVKNTYSRKRVFLIGNGPSLNKTPLHLLKNEITFCMNRFNLMFDRINWLPEFYGISDDVVILDMINELDEIRGKVKNIFLPDIHPSSPININYKKIIENHEKIYWFHPDKIGFSAVLPVLGINKTVTNVAIQILVYLGFEEIYLIGVDLDYKEQKSAKDLDNRHLKSDSDDDPNHFDPRYFGSGRKYHIPRMEETLEKFKEAKEFCNNHNVKIYNATIGGKLEIFPRVNFKDVMNTNKKSELQMILDIVDYPSNGCESFRDVFPDAHLLSTIDQWNDIDEKIIVPLDLGYKLIPQKILTHLPLGPFNNEYLFINRDAINSKDND